MDKPSVYMAKRLSLHSFNKYGVLKSIITAGITKEKSTVMVLFVGENMDLHINVYIPKLTIIKAKEEMLVLMIE
jgi:hypothetical protein